MEMRFSVPDAGMASVLVVLAQRGSRLFHAARSYEEVLKMPTFSIVSLREVASREARAASARNSCRNTSATSSAFPRERLGCSEPGEGETLSGDPSAGSMRRRKRWGRDWTYAARLQGLDVRPLGHRCAATSGRLRGVGAADRRQEPGNQ